MSTTRGKDVRWSVCIPGSERRTPKTQRKQALEVRGGGIWRSAVWSHLRNGKGEASCWSLMDAWWRGSSVIPRSPVGAVGEKQPVWCLLGAHLGQADWTQQREAERSNVFLGSAQWESSLLEGSSSFLSREIQAGSPSGWRYPKRNIHGRKRPLLKASGFRKRRITQPWSCSPCYCSFLLQPQEGQRPQKLPEVGASITEKEQGERPWTPSTFPRRKLPIYSRFSWIREEA